MEDVIIHVPASAIDQEGCQSPASTSSSNDEALKVGTEGRVIFSREGELTTVVSQGETVNRSNSCGYDGTDPSSESLKETSMNMGGRNSLVCEEAPVGKENIRFLVRFGSMIYESGMKLASCVYTNCTGPPPPRFLVRSGNIYKFMSLVLS